MEKHAAQGQPAKEQQNFAENIALPKPRPVLYSQTLSALFR